MYMYVHCGDTCGDGKGLMREKQKKETKGDKRRQRETKGDKRGQRETKGDKRRQKETKDVKTEGRRKEEGGNTNEE